MIQVEKLSYGFPAKDLYKDISFTLEDDYVISNKDGEE